MPVHIDQIDSEIEIVPSTDGERRTPGTAGGGSATPAPADGLRRAVVRALDEELQEYLRIRG